MKTFFKIIFLILEIADAVMIIRKIKEIDNQENTDNNKPIAILESQNIEIIN